MPEFTPARLAELRAVAEAATEGPWYAQECACDLGPHTIVSSVAVGPIVEGGFWSDGDVPHIATFDPPTVLALIDALEAKTAEVEAAIERVRAVHRKAHAVFSWSEGGVRYEEPCENCDGAPGVHDCGCWADEQIEYVCAECDRDKGKHRDSSWPCATIQAIKETP